ncbi:hypothetical protein QTP70_032529 [Hemibagrus guttatus]|uniref:Solute carrier family 2, facilitated glucose transporter member 5 n=1 Tax=Hemibagrus guttatus TaxID=175788 RepID=A0AAE0Q758_9TELE|nr:hypothetical protein QTP70_032529 [Hemibagrus guttatus]
MLQTISPDLLPFITTVINGSLTSGHVPTAFKKARVIPILKKPALDPSDISNYRPVSLLSFLSKILKRVVCNQLSDYLLQNNLHDPNQSGFKAAHSTETALLAVTEKLHAARSAKLSSVLILLDLSAAFDTVNHKTLLSTLRSLGICGTAWEWFASYLDGRSYQVTWKGLTSAPRRLSTGVPQGSVLGPLLFSIYTHSLGKVISSHGFSYHCYADDTQLIFSMINGVMTEHDDGVAWRARVPRMTLLMVVWAAGIGGTFQYGYNISIINAPTKASQAFQADSPLEQTARRLKSPKTLKYHHGTYSCNGGPPEEVQRFINQTWMQRYDRHISAELLTLLWSSIVSIFTIGGLVGASVGASLAVRFGRKGTLLINNSFALLAAVLMGLSSLTAAFELLIAGRFISGINAGVGLCVQPLYLGEIAPRALRGAMAMGTSIFITGGILTGQVMGLTELLGGEHYWPLLLISPCVPAVLQLIFLPQFPESPRFLLIDRDDEVSCTAALKQLHGGEDFQVEMEDMQQERISAEGIEPKKPWQLFTECRNHWPLFIIIFISTAQQLNGINAQRRSLRFISMQNMSSVKPEFQLETFPMSQWEREYSFLIERLGRRALIIGGYALMSLWCICFTLTLSFQKSSSLVPYLSMLCVFAFILSFGLGPGGVTNILITELFTQTTRPAAYLIAGSVNWLSFFFISLVFPFIVVRSNSVPLHSGVSTANHLSPPIPIFCILNTCTH